LGSCSNPKEYVDVTDGEHTFRLRASDPAGNVGAQAAHVWTVDTVAPVTTIHRAPPDPSNDEAPSFEFAASEAASFACRLDAGDWAAGNVGPEATYTWTIDTVAPVTTIDDAPASPSKDRAPSFESRADEAGAFECRLDGGQWSACTSPQG